MLSVLESYLLTTQQFWRTQVQWMGRVYSFTCQISIYDFHKMHMPPCVCAAAAADHQLVIHTVLIS